MHHIKTTSFAELSGAIGIEQIPSEITRDAELASHASQPNVHHTRYTDAEVAAAETDPQVGEIMNNHELIINMKQTFESFSDSFEEKQTWLFTKVIDQTYNYYYVRENYQNLMLGFNTLLQGNDPAIVIECLNGYRLKEKLPSNLGSYTVPIGIP